ncbi:class I SAM-dependent methyltransferase [Pantoea sp. Mhis]|uniref:class I SAM-dependent methyltransferase n=1 Tax=Pantoea sp. Mhis TaxID=2576759 RepID=UPI00351B5718
MLYLENYEYLKEKIKEPLFLASTPMHLELRKLDEPKMGGIFVDFISSAITYRRRFCKKNKEALVKAIGIKRNYLPNVIDATGGLGRDAFILASMGCHVIMMERNLIVASLLYDGLKRGYSNIIIGHWLRERLSLLHTVSQYSLSKMIRTSTDVDVVYLDPMYPNTGKKHALVKKEMRILQLLVGEDKDADTLLELARTLAKQRVVVKRPQYAPPLGGIQTNSVIKTKKHRFDIYQPI